MHARPYARTFIFYFHSDSSVNSYTLIFTYLIILESSFRFIFTFIFIITLSLAFKIERMPASTHAVILLLIILFTFTLTHTHTHNPAITHTVTKHTFRFLLQIWTHTNIHITFMLLPTQIFYTQSSRHIHIHSYSYVHNFFLKNLLNLFGIGQGHFMDGCKQVVRIIERYLLV